MRVLLVPEIYRADALACGTLQDAIAWVDRWLALDPHLHVYWILPPRREAGYAAEDVHAHRERVTLLEALTLARPSTGDEPVLTDAGYARGELAVIQEGIVDPGGYVDAIVDQRRSGQLELRQWLLALADNPWAGELHPFEVVVNVHDLQVPRKHRGCAHRDRAQMELEIAHAAAADGVWFTAGVDREAWRRLAPQVLAEDRARQVLASSTTTASPLSLEEFQEVYAERPQTVHLAGSFWEKKQTGEVLAIARRLHEERGLQTVLTSMDPLPAAIPEEPWLEAHGRASRSTYERALREGDVAICASAYETMARTPFEQAASGQVLLARRRPWIEECVPEGHPLLAPLDALADRALAVVDDWSSAVAANRELVAHLRRTRSPRAVGKRTYRDLRQRLERKQKRFRAAALVDHVQALLARLGTPVELAEVLAQPAAGADGASLAEREDVTRSDVVHALRACGLVDEGRSPVPVFGEPELCSGFDRPS